MQVRERGSITRWSVSSRERVQEDEEDETNGCEAKESDKNCGFNWKILSVDLKTKLIDRLRVVRGRPRPNLCLAFESLYFPEKFSLYHRPPGDKRREKTTKLIRGMKSLTLSNRHHCCLSGRVTPEEIDVSNPDGALKV